MKESKKLRRSLIVAVLALLGVLFSITAATFAWYIFNSSARTTEVRMVAGSSVTIQIASTVDTNFKTSTQMETFRGALNPVSTDRISNGFQRAEAFEDAPQESGNRIVASLFGRGEAGVDYHKTSLFLRTNAEKATIYLSGIDFTKDSAGKSPPIATAMRLGLVVKDGQDENGNYPEFIFELTSEESPFRDTSDNADRFQDGRVLDSTKTDGSYVNFTPLNSDNFCDYDKNTGIVSPKPGSVVLCTLENNGTEKYGQPVEVEIYLWLEGTDLDCTRELVGNTLEQLTLSFVGEVPKGSEAE